MAVHRKPMRRQKLGWTKAWAKPTQPGNALPCVVDDGDPRAKVRHIAANRLHGAEFTDVAHGALARRHKQAARAVQVVPLRLVLAVAVEHLHAMVLAVGHIDPAVGIAGYVVRDVELARIGARPAPGEIGAIDRRSLAKSSRWNVPVICIATIARPTAIAAAHGAGPHSLTTNSPTRVDTRWPPIKARGCAGSAVSEPNTVTIEVANGIATNGNAAVTENASMLAIAIAPPTAPASMARN